MSQALLAIQNILQNSNIVIDLEKQSFLRPSVIKKLHNSQVFCPLQWVTLKVEED